MVSCFRNARLSWFPSELGGFQGFNYIDKGTVRNASNRFVRMLRVWARPRLPLRGIGARTAREKVQPNQCCQIVICSCGLRQHGQLLPTLVSEAARYPLYDKGLRTQDVPDHFGLGEIQLKTRVARLESPRPAHAECSAHGSWCSQLGQMKPACTPCTQCIRTLGGTRRRATGLWRRG